MFSFNAITAFQREKQQVEFLIRNWRARHHLQQNTIYFDKVSVMNAVELFFSSEMSFADFEQYINHHRDYKKALLFSDVEYIVAYAKAIHKKFNTEGCFDEVRKIALNFEFKS